MDEGRRVRGLLAGVGAALVRAALSLLGAALLTRVCLALAPGDAIDTLPDPELRAALAAEWGLDGSLGDRLVAQLGELVRGDLGESLTWRPGVAVPTLLAELGPASALRIVSAAALAVALGHLLVRRRTALVALPSALPGFLAVWAAISLLNATAWAGMEHGWWGRPAWFTLPDTPSLLRSALALGILATASGSLGQTQGALAAERRAVEGAAFVDAALNRGEPVAGLIRRHLVAPTARAFADRVPALLGALVVVERLLDLPGLGGALWEACRLRDWPVASAIVLAFAGFVVFVRLLADLVALAVDPRRRAGMVG